VPRRLLLTMGAIALTATLSAGCADSVAPAATAGDVTVTRDELMDEVAEWAGNDATQRAQTLPAGTHAFQTAGVSEILGERIILEILAAKFDDLGLELTDELRQAALSTIGIDPSQEDQLLGGFSDEYHQAYLESYAKGVGVQTELGADEFVSFLNAAARDVEVDPRYGTWDPARFTVVPPTPPSGPSSDATSAP
jgi:hypothetical protein